MRYYQSSCSNKWSFDFFCESFAPAGAAAGARLGVGDAALARFTPRTVFASALPIKMGTEACTPELAGVADVVAVAASAGSGSTRAGASSGCGTTAGAIADAAGEPASTVLDCVHTTRIVMRIATVARAPSTLRMTAIIFEE